MPSGGVTSLRVSTTGSGLKTAGVTGLRVRVRGAEVTAGVTGVRVKVGAGPAASAGPDVPSAMPGQLVTLSSAASTSLLGIVSRRWSLVGADDGDGGAVPTPDTPGGTSGSTLTFRPQAWALGVVYTWSVTVTDSAGQTGTATVRVAVAPSQMYQMGVDPTDGTRTWLPITVIRFDGTTWGSAPAYVPPPVTPDPTPAPLPRLLTRDTSTGRIMAGSTPVRSGGVNVFQLIVNDYPSNRLMTKPEIDSLLNKAATINARFIRSHTLGANAGSASYNLVTGVSGTGANPTITYNETVWQLMDYAIAKAGTLGLYLMPAMFDQAAVTFSNNFAGSLLTWVKFRQPSATNWELFYTDTQCLYDQRKFLRDFAARVNTVNGLTYANDPTLWAWETGNEMWKGDTYRQWITDTAAAMKAAAPSMLVSDGTAADTSSYWRSAGQDQDPVAHVITSTALASPNVDIVGIHPYSTATTADVETGIQRAAVAGKAFILGEYPWTKLTGNAPAPDLEALIRKYPNAITSMPWSLQNDPDLHNNGAALGSDDVSLYVPGKDATTQAMVTRVSNHGAALQSGSTA